MVNQRAQHLLPLAQRKQDQGFGNVLELRHSFDVLTGSPIDEARKGLYGVLVPSHPDDGSSASSWKWLCAYLDRCIKEDWDVVLAPALKGLSNGYPKDVDDQRTQLAKVYQVITTVVGAIKVSGDVSIDGIVDELHTRDVFNVTTAGHFEEKRNFFRQMVWCLVGLITMLYEPQRRRPEDKLGLRRSASTLRGMGRRDGRNVSFYQNDIHHSQSTLHNLLKQFGNLIPLVEVDANYLSGIDYDYVNVAYINYSTLKNVAKLGIEWVDTMNLHLKLDKRRHVLQLFRYPALCQLLWTDMEDSFMEKLYAEFCKTQTGHEIVEFSMSDYLREVMLSYRLLFGIDRSSRNAFKTLISDWQPWSNDTNFQPTQTPTSSNPFPSTPTSPRTHSRQTQSSIKQDRQSQLKIDPVLHLLCTTENPSRTTHLSESQEQLSELLSALRGEETTSTLYDLEDFPFLGRRLHDLERFSRIQKPNDWKSVFWIDRRDSASFWNSMIACALLFIGGGTIVLQFIQLIFQIWGTLLAKQQSPSK